MLISNSPKDIKSKFNDLDETMERKELYMDGRGEIHNLAGPNETYFVLSTGALQSPGSLIAAAGKAAAAKPEASAAAGKAAAAFAGVARVVVASAAVAK